MEAERLLDLWDALAARKAAYITVSESADDTKAEAENAAAAAEAHVNTLQSALWASYPQPFVRCRDVGHVWDVKDEMITETLTLSRELQCYRCTSRRHDEVNKAGEIVSRVYRHADDYLMPKGAGGFGKPFWRGLTYMVVARG